MNILMIEDDRELCTAVSFRLEQEGFSVTVCHDGEEGLYYMQESPFVPGWLSRWTAGWGSLPSQIGRASCRERV